MAQSTREFRSPKPVIRLPTPVENFLQSETSGGIILIGAALIAFIWANSPWSASYFEMKHATTGIELGSFSEAGLVSLATVGVFFGLLVGKPLGVVGATWLAVKAGVTQLPPGVTWKGITGVGFLAGIGFTMALFIANLAFGSGAVLDQAKIGILSASVVAAILGLVFLWRAFGEEAPKPREAG